MTIKKVINKVLFDEEVHAKITHWVNKSSIEVSGLGRCIRTEDGNYKVIEAYLLEQENTATTTDIDAEAASKLMFETREDEGHLNFWWHSHVNMGVFWSGTDTATIESFGSAGFCLATVFNKKGDMRSAYYQGGTDFYAPVFVDNIPNEIHHEIDKSKIEAWDQEFDKKCKVKKWTPPKKSGRRAGLLGTKVNKGGSVYNKTKYDEHGFPYNAPYDEDEAYVQESMIKADKEKENTYTPFVYNEELDSAKLPAAKRQSGMIHPTMDNMRWDAGTSCYIDYDSYRKKFPKLWAPNEMDHLGTREWYIHQFVAEYGFRPVDDYDVDLYYMDIHRMDEGDFYDYE